MFDAWLTQTLFGVESEDGSLDSWKTGRSPPRRANRSPGNGKAAKPAPNPQKSQKQTIKHTLSIHWWGLGAHNLRILKSLTCWAWQHIPLNRSFPVTCTSHFHLGTFWCQCPMRSRSQPPDSFGWQSICSSKGVPDEQSTLSIYSRQPLIHITLQTPGIRKVLQCVAACAVAALGTGKMSESTIVGIQIRPWTWENHWKVL